MPSTGCERDLFNANEVGVVVVDAVLRVDARFPAIRVGRTLDPTQPFDPVAAVEENADVRITGDGMELFYVRSPDQRGVYVPGDPAALVMPDTMYELRVLTADDELITARTRTPPRVGAIDWLVLNDDGTEVVGEFTHFEDVGDQVYEDNQVVYSDGLLEARFARDLSDPRQIAYEVGLFSLDLDSDFVIDPEFFDEEDFDDLDRIISSPMFVAEEGEIRLPWLAIYFAGRYKFYVYSVDRNWFDLVRSLPEAEAGFTVGGNTGDGFDRPLFHVEGGIGLFGSASVDSIGLTVLPRDP